MITQHDMAHDKKRVLTTIPEDEECLLSSSHSSHRPSSPSGRLLVVILGLASFTLSIHGFLFWHQIQMRSDFVQSSSPQSPSSEQLIRASHGHSPFSHVIQYKTVEWATDAWDNSIYVGQPSQDLDDAWDKLQAIQGIRVHPEEAQKINLTSNIKLDGGDQGVITGYYHNLHCLRYLYQGLHPNVYKRDQDPAHAGDQHSYHCIEVLRRSVLCNPDLTLHEIYWEDDRKLGMKLRPESSRQCVDFDRIYEFSATRKFPREAIVDA